MNITLFGNDISEYTIVSPSDTLTGEDYAVTEIRQVILEKTGILLPVVEKSAGADAKEIIVGGEAPVNHGFFTFLRKPPKLWFGAEDLFGYARIACFVRGNLFNEAIYANKEIKVEVGKDIIRDIDLDAFREKTGSIRVMFHNIWGMEPFPFCNRQKYVGEYHLSYDTDVIGFNERYGEYVTKPIMHGILTDHGYAEAPIVSTAHHSGVNAMPIYYKTDKLELLDHGFENFRAGDVSKGISLAVFEEKKTGKRFIFCVTHLNSAWDRTVQDANLSRLKDVQYIVPFVEGFLRKWEGLPVLIGGDFNCRGDAEAMRMFAWKGFADARSLAEYANDECSCHGYPKYSEEQKAFVTGTPVTFTPYVCGIDHTVVKNPEKLRIRLYRTMMDSICYVMSDHCPQMLEFDLL